MRIAEGAGRSMLNLGYPLRVHPSLCAYHERPSWIYLVRVPGTAATDPGTMKRTEGGLDAESCRPSSRPVGWHRPGEPGYPRRL